MMVNSNSELESALAKPDELVKWYEWPLLLYFMLHFFPPFPAPLPNLCLVLSLFGVLHSCSRQPAKALERLNHPLVWIWLLLAGLLGASIFQAPEAMRAESWHRFVSDLGKGSIFGAILVLHLDNIAKAKRILIAGVLAACVILLHYAISTILIVQASGTLPLQRDYLYWLMLYFPFAVGCYFVVPQWRVPAIVAALGIVFLAFAAGFRGAILSLAIMFLAFAFLPRFWHLLIGAGICAAGSVTWLVMKFPEQATYTLGKLQQTGSSGRVAHHWMPAWELSLDHPWAGNGFGHQVFSFRVNQGLLDHPSWLPLGASNEWAPSSPHSIVFEVLFAAGFPALLTLVVLGWAIFFYLGLPLWRLRHVRHDSLSRYFAYSVLIALVGAYGIFSQFEAPAWRTFSVLLGLAVAASRLIPLMPEPRKI